MCRNVVELKKDSATAPRISLHSVKCEMLRLSEVAEEKNINYFFFYLKLLRFFHLSCWFGASVKHMCPVKAASFTGIMSIPIRPCWADLAGMNLPTKAVCTLLLISWF